VRTSLIERITNVRRRYGLIAFATAVVLAGGLAACGDDAGRSSAANPRPTLPTPTPVEGRISGCDLLTPEEVGYHLDVPTPEAEDHSFVPGPNNSLMLPPSLECQYLDPDDATIYLYATLDAQDSYERTPDQRLAEVMAPMPSPKPIRVRGLSGSFSESYPPNGMPVLAVAFRDDPWIQALRLSANSPAATQDTLRALAEAMLIRFGR
jgi:hypothetical protein